jgi:hypothetical protein
VTHILRKCFANHVKDKTTELDVELLEALALLDFCNLHGRPAIFAIGKEDLHFKVAISRRGCCCELERQKRRSLRDSPAISSM